MPFLDLRSLVSPSVSQVHLEGAWKGLCDRQGQGPGTSRSSCPDPQRPPLGGLLPHLGAQPAFPGGSPPSAPGASQSGWGGWKLLETSRGNTEGRRLRRGAQSARSPPSLGALALPSPLFCPCPTSAGSLSPSLPWSVPLSAKVCVHPLLFSLCSTFSFLFTPGASPLRLALRLLLPHFPLLGLYPLCYCPSVLWVAAWSTSCPPSASGSPGAGCLPPLSILARGCLRRDPSTSGALLPRHPEAGGS